MLVLSSADALLCLVRHARTDWNEMGKLQGRSDTPLNSEGKHQARQVSQALARIDLPGGRQWSVLYSSPLTRAFDTAQAIGAAIGLKPQRDEELVERAFGTLEGYTREQLERQHPDWRDRPHEFPGMESEEALVSRVNRVLSRIGRTHLGQAVIVVTHGAFINAFLRGLPDVSDKRLSVGNAGYSLVAGDGTSWRLLAFNVDDHLEQVG